VYQENTQAVDRWVELFNTDVHRWIDECYADEFHIVCPGIIEITDRATFHQIEQAVLDAEPTRKGRLTDVIPAGDRVTVEGVLYGGTDTPWETHWCAILRFKDGRIVSDHSYVDRTQWPWLKDLPGQEVAVHGQAAAQ
jgi:ketosteroid isomerase-like protein